MNIQRLSNKVQAKNNAAAARNAILPKVVALAKEFAGVKVQLATSTNFTAKFRKAVEALALPNSNGIQSWLSGTNHSVSLNVRSCVTSGAGTSYADAYYFLGSLDNGVLTPDGNEAQQWRADFSVDEILKARAEVRDAKEALQAAERGLCGFGESDHC